MASKMNTARKTFANTVAPTLAAPIENPMISVEIGGQMVKMTLKDLLALQAAATAPAPKSAAKAKRNVPAPEGAPVVSAPVVPVDFTLDGKEKACFAAAKAAVKAAGLAWNGVKGPGSKGGRFDQPTKYWAAFWAGYNAKAVELGIPVKAPPAK